MSILEYIELPRSSLPCLSRLRLVFQIITPSVHDIDLADRGYYLHLCSIITLTCFIRNQERASVCNVFHPVPHCAKGTGLVSESCVWLSVIAMEL